MALTRGFLIRAIPLRYSYAREKALSRNARNYMILNEMTRSVNGRMIVHLISGNWTRRWMRPTQRDGPSWTEARLAAGVPFDQQ